MPKEPSRTLRWKLTILRGYFAEKVYTYGRDGRDISFAINTAEETRDETKATRENFAGELRGERIETKNRIVYSRYRIADIEYQFARNPGYIVQISGHWPAATFCD